MVEVLDQSFLELSLHDVSELLLQKLCENISDGKEYSMAKLKGSDGDGNLYEMDIIMRRLE